MAFIPIFLLFGIAFLTLVNGLFSSSQAPEPPDPTPEQKLAAAIAEYMKSHDQSDSDNK